MKRSDSDHESSANSLRVLLEILNRLPRFTRSEWMLKTARFHPQACLDEEFVIGPLRAAFADYWEQVLGTPVPLRELRAALEAPLPIATVLAFSRLKLVETEADLQREMNNLVRHLNREVSAQHQSQQTTFLSSNGHHYSAPRPVEVAGTKVHELDALVRQGRRYATVYADPPWAYTNTASRAAAVNHYPTMSVAEICELPIGQLAADNAHLHLWTTNGFLRDSFDVIDAWGFTFKSCCVWVKSELGMGNYWRVSHEFLMLGVRGSLTFADRTLPSWIQAPRTIHSRKPGIVRSLIERVSPGPYLELFGREAWPDSQWTVFGNQIEEHFF